MIVVTRDPTETDNPLMRDACRAPTEFYTRFISSPDVKGKWWHWVNILRDWY